jgi:hypothetical protein
MRLFILLIALCGAIAASRAALHVTNGLQSEYFVGDRPSAVPAINIVSPVVSTSRMTAAWNESVPPIFHVRWFGYLIINRPGPYTLATTSDDGSSVKVDDNLVVENGGVHGSRTRTGQIELGEGPHFVLIEYFQAGGSYEMTWLWAQDGGQLSPVPPWVTSPQRISSSRALIAHRLDQLFMIALACLVVVAAWALFAYGGVLTPQGSLLGSGFGEQH